MKVLIIHNHYLEKGGEDEAVSAEISLLKEHGQEVILYEKSNENISKLPFLKKFFFILNELNFSKAVYNEIKGIAKKEKPDIAHIHNIFICISPSVYLALKKENVPIVQTLHNYRFFCLRGTFFKNGKICEKCKNRQFINAIVGKCWRGSLLLSLLLVKVLVKGPSFFRDIDSFITLSNFSKNKFIELGLEGKRIYLKPNLLITARQAEVHDLNYALFIGRLVDYKGIETLMGAFKTSSSFSLKIVGDGPLRKKVDEFCSLRKNVEWLGTLGKDSIFELIRNSSFIIFPSQCYENMPMVIIESFAFSKPVVASNLGAVREFVIDEVNGILFEAGNAEDLAAKISYLFSHQKEREELGKNANKFYKEKFDKENNYRTLMNIYTETINSKGV